MRLLDYLNTRLGFTARHRRVMDRPVPEGINYFSCFGGIAFTLFILLLLTGLLLSVHHWAAQLMVVLVLLHMLRVFITGAYKNPRELNWATGAALLVLTLSFGFTGYLLPWDQKAYWATVVGTNMLGSTPLIG